MSVWVIKCIVDTDKKKMFLFQLIDVVFKISDVSNVLNDVPGNFFKRLGSEPYKNSKFYNTI